MATPDQIARTYQRRQRSIILAVVAAVLGLWKRLDEHNLTLSWQTGIGPQMVEMVMRAQLAAAAAAPTYLEELAAAQGVSADLDALVPSALSGIASDGRPLESLLYQPIILLKRLLTAGKQPEEAMRQATNFMALIASTQVADAGRGAVNVGITATREWVTYVRVVNLPACSRCIILAGREYSWSTGFQRHPNCFPAGTTVSGPANRAATRRWYEGEFAIITTTSGQELSATGNHPVLTDRGWLPANLLQPGDYVVRSLLGEGAIPLVVPNERQMPARIEDLWRPDGVGRLVRMPTSPEDFHGDGGHGEVDVVSADGFLRDGGISPRPEEAVHEFFSRAANACNTLAPHGLVADLFVSARDAADRIMRGGGLGGPLLGGHLRSTHLASIGVAADLDALLFKTSPDRWSANPVTQAQAVLALPGQVCGHDFLNGEVDSLATRWDAPGTYGSVDDRLGYASRGLDLLGRLAGQVELDRVIDVRRTTWSGHVYNLSSNEGWYSANGLIVSNCDCSMMPRHSGDRPLATPEQLFAQMSPKEQDQRFGKAGAEALRLGADMGQVVNARRGMRTAAGGRLITTEGTTARGAAGKRLGNLQKAAGDRYRRSRIVRPMPEQLIADADGDRDLAIQFLERFGYLDATSTRRRTAASNPTSTPAAT